jgi:hypothetical protein
LDENETGEPESEAIWWAGPSWFVQMTVVPVLIVTVAGLNAKFLMVIELDPPEEAGVVIAIVVTAGDVVAAEVVVTCVVDAGVVGVGVIAGLCGEVQPALKLARISMMVHTDQNKNLELKTIVLS